MYCQSNNWWRFRKILWPSQNIWNLKLMFSNLTHRATVYNTGVYSKVHSINKYYIHSTYCNNKQQMIKVQLPKIILYIFYQDIKTCTLRPLRKSGISLTIWFSKNDRKWNSQLPISWDIWGNLKNHVLCSIEYIFNNMERTLVLFFF